MPIAMVSPLPMLGSTLDISPFKTSSPHISLHNTQAFQATSRSVSLHLSLPSCPPHLSPPHLSPPPPLSPSGRHLRPEIPQGPLPKSSTRCRLFLLSFHALEMGCKFSSHSCVDLTSPDSGLHHCEGERESDERCASDLWSGRCSLLGQLHHLW
jgi:hypothetical protein